MGKARYLIGMVAKCSRGKIGFITGRRIVGSKTRWVGVSLDGYSNNSRLWASSEPKIIAKSILDYEDMIKKAEGVE